MSHGSLAKALGKSYDYTKRWFVKGGHIPSAKNVAAIEAIVDLNTGTLEQLVTEDRRIRQGKAFRRIWANRKKNYTREIFKAKLKAGDFHNGKHPWKDRSVEDSNRNSGAHGPRPLHHRLKVSVAKTIFSPLSSQGHSNVFVLCVMCRKAVCKTQVRVSEFKNHFHPTCWQDWMHRGVSTRTPNKTVHSTTNSPKVDELMRFWLAHNILGMSYRQIAEKFNASSTEAVKKAVGRAAQWLPEYWGPLLPTRGSSRPSATKLLGRFTTDEVVRIAKQDHSLSHSTGDAEITSYSSETHQQRSGYNPDPVVDTPLAHLVADRIRNQYPSRTAAARAIGIGLVSLNHVLYGHPKRLNKVTVTAVSAFLDIPEPAFVQVAGFWDAVPPSDDYSEIVNSMVEAQKADRRLALGEVSNNQLSQTVADRVIEFKTRREAGQVAGLDPTVLNFFLNPSKQFGKASRKGRSRRINRATWQKLALFTGKNIPELQEMWAKNSPAWNPDPAADTEIARLVANNLRGKYSSLLAAARAVGVSSHALTNILYGEQGFVVDSTARSLALLLGMTATQVKTVVKANSVPSATGDSQADVPVVASADPVQLALT
jgi:hypothetical protein